MVFEVKTKFEIGVFVYDRNSKKATVVDAELRYSETSYSYKVMYLIEYENKERRWIDEYNLTDVAPKTVEQA
jgi:hypothetical protein